MPPSSPSWRRTRQALADGLPLPTEIDDAVGGFKRSKLYVFAAAEKMGKSALALTVGREFLLQDIPVAIFSLEMKADEISQRLIAMESGINTLNRKQGCFLSEEEIERLSAATGPRRIMAALLQRPRNADTGGDCHERPARTPSASKGPR